MNGPRLATCRVDGTRGHTYRLDNKKCDGVTTIIKGGLPAPALTYWAANTVAQYVIDHFDEVGQAVALRPDTAYYHLKQTPWADRDAAANRGTEVHRFAEQITGGTHGDEEPPEELVGHIEAMAQFLIDWQPTFDRIECVVASREHRYMGTFDFLGHLPGLGYVLGDWKTNRSGIYPETALQLAAYRYAEFIITETGEEIPMPEVDACVAVHVTGDGYEVVPVVADEWTFRQFLYVQCVHNFGKQAKGLIGDPVLPPSDVAVSA